MKLIRPVMTEDEGRAAQTVLKAVVERRMLVEHDADLVGHAAEALAVAITVAKVSPTDPKRGGARTSDPDTSKQAARSVVASAANLRGAILRMMVKSDRPMTPAEIEAAVGKCGLWRRVTELRQGLYIELTGERRVSDTTGASQRVYVVTELGREWVEANHEADDAA